MRAETCSIDFETRSAINLWTQGAYRYAEDPSTEIMVASYAFDDEPVQRWVPLRGEPFPDNLREYASTKGVFRAHNAQFERIIWREKIAPTFGVSVDLEQWRCTAAEAAAMALPRSLDKVAKVLRVPHQKDGEGHKLMKKYSKPRKIEDDGTIIWWDDPEDLERLYLYCDRDVEAERAVSKRLRRLGSRELETYQFDQRMNDRGVLIDKKLVVAAEKIVVRSVQEANDELVELTGGDVDAVTKVAKLTEWLQKQDVDLDNLRKDTVRDLLESPGIEGDVERVLQLRKEAGRSSTAKLATMLGVISPRDNRARGLQLYHGATTGRWSGKHIQPHNFPRGTVGYKDYMKYLMAVYNGEYARISEEHPPVELISSMLRSMIVAAPGHRLDSGDFSQIEARIVCWIAGDTYEDYEYEKMAGIIFGESWQDIRTGYKAGDPEYVEKRNIGKNTVLGCGFGMGVDTYIEQAHRQSGMVVPRDIAERAVEAYRTRKARVQQFWYDINDSAMAAVQSPGTVVKIGRRGMVRFVKQGKFLWMVLPSGRPLAYALPSIEMHTVRPKGKGKQPFQKLGLSYRGVNPKTRQWGKRRTYGGHLTENVVQAMARDIMRDAALRVEKAGYRPVLLVHDEVLSETPKDHGDQDEYLALMMERPEWAHDCPIKAEGWSGKRYRK